MSNYDMIPGNMFSNLIVR